MKACEYVCSECAPPMFKRKGWSFELADFGMRSEKDLNSLDWLTMCRERCL